MRVICLAIVGLVVFSVSALGLTPQEEFAYDEAKRRISPVNIILDVNDSARCYGFRAGSTYRITWTVLGYDNDYNSTTAIWDCTDADNANFRCGENWNSQGTRFLTFSKQQPIAERNSTTWGYTASNGTYVHAREFDFQVDFTMPATRTHEAGSPPWETYANGGNQLVFRWYQIADTEDPSDGTISIILGSEIGHRYGNNARRITQIISSDLNNSQCP